MVKRDCCKTCGFPINMERKPVFLDNNVLSYALYESNKCEECGHQKDGTTIPSVYYHWQGLCNNFIKERKQLIDFIKKYNSLSEEERKEVCIELPRFMRKDYVPDDDEDFYDIDVKEPYNWNVVYLEVMNNTPLSKVMIRDYFEMEEIK